VSEKTSRGAVKKGTIGGGIVKGGRKKGKRVRDFHPPVNSAEGDCCRRMKKESREKQGEGKERGPPRKKKKTPYRSRKGGKRGGISEGRKKRFPKTRRGGGVTLLEEIRTSCRSTEGGAVRRGKEKPDREGFTVSSNTPAKLT